MTEILSLDDAVNLRKELERDSKTLVFTNGVFDLLHVGHLDYLEKARELVLQSRGIERTKELARVHAERAMEAVLPWKDSVHRDALINLAYKVVQRTT